MSMSREATLGSGTPRDWIWELEQRAALATPQDTTRGLFFTSILDSVRALGDEAALARCLEVLGGQQFMTFFNYPIILLMRLTATAVRELGVRYGGPEEALRMLGRKATKDFMASAVGNAVRLMAGKDIKRFMCNVQTIYKMTASYGQRSVVWLGPKAGRLLIHRSFMPPPYHEGVLQETLKRMGAKGVKVECRQTAPLDSTYDFSWE
jgi:uncharacterized protein (TIGR02265 family)